MNTMSWRWEWKAEHDACGACASLARGTPYPPDQLPSWPGQKGTCGNRCRCTVSVYSDDWETFTRAPVHRDPVTSDYPDFDCAAYIDRNFAIKGAASPGLCQLELRELFLRLGAAQDADAWYDVAVTLVARLRNLCSNVLRDCQAFFPARFLRAKLTLHLTRVSYRSLTCEAFDEIFQELLAIYPGTIEFARLDGFFPDMVTTVLFQAAECYSACKDREKSQRLLDHALTLELSLGKWKISAATCSSYTKIACHNYNLEAALQAWDRRNCDPRPARAADSSADVLERRARAYVAKKLNQRPTRAKLADNGPVVG